MAIQKEYMGTSELFNDDCTLITFGSGGNYAYAGLQAGLSPEESVLLAAKCDRYTDDNVSVKTFGEGNDLIKPSDV